jgi:hypothetical protein
MTEEPLTGHGVSNNRERPGQGFEGGRNQLLEICSGQV